MFAGLKMCCREDVARLQLFAVISAEYKDPLAGLSLLEKRL